MDDYTGAYSGDYNELIYLRARHYALNTGRFLTRDMWSGDANSPLSFNRWNYTNANPINYTDPSGNYGTPPPWSGCGALGYVSLSWAANYANKNVSLSKSYWLNTYTAAGIAVQCWAGSIQDIIVADPNYSGLGPGQITNQEVVTSYGIRIPNPDDLNNKKRNRGFGLRCYLPIAHLPPEILFTLAESCTYCFSPEQINGISGFNNLYQLEPIHDQTNIDWAVIYMKRRIKSVMDVCDNRGCHDTDKFIAAALVQNSPGFTQYHMEHEVFKLSANQPNQKAAMNWERYFKGNQAIDTSTQLYRFKQAIQGLISKNWFVPAIDMNFVDYLINRNFTGTVPQ